MSDNTTDGTLTKDKNSEPIQVLELGAVDVITTSGTSAAVTLPGSATTGDIVRIAATENCYITFGATATTSDHLFVQGVEYFRVPAGATQLAAIQVDTAGRVTVTRMQ